MCRTTSYSTPTEIRRPAPRTAVVAIVLMLASAAVIRADDPVDFRTQIQPLLQKHCLHCHGEKKQESGLRFDRKALALQGGDSGKPAIVPGKPNESRLLQLVRGDDPERVMPPEGEPLTADEIKLLARWIEAGADWPEDSRLAQRSAHWSFVRPQRPPLPAVANVDWTRNAIDAFILARLEKEGLPPNPEAGRETLIRRLSLDLIGLPPSQTDVDEFLNDNRPDAYERLVDRLLASPHYGQRWARRWLDLARYADTNGYEKDRARSIWLWRDWVIQSLNADMPFDQFTIEQLAGDLLPDATLSQRIATGFHRNTMINEEGGIDVEEFRFHSVVDRVGTTATVWLGLTLACAQCHSHKYDPISQREFYGVFAFFNNCDEPEIAVPNPAVESRRQAVEAKISQLESARAARFPLPESDGNRRQQHLAERLSLWQEEQRAKAVRWTVLRPRKVVARGGATMTIDADGSVLAGGDKPNRDTYEVTLTVPLDRITALRLEVLPDDSLPDRGPGRAPLFSVGDFLLSEIAVDHFRERDWRRLSLGNATESYAQPGRSTVLATDGDLDTGWSIQGRTVEAHQAVFPLKEPIDRFGEEPPRLRVILTQHYIHQMTIGRFRISATDQVGEVRAIGLPSDVEDLLLRPSESLDEQELARLQAAFLTSAPELAEANKAIAELRKSLPPFPTTMVMQERAAQDSRTTHRHGRGEFLKREEPVSTGVPAILPPLPEGDQPRDRLAFARWLVSLENPLTARVTVNRHWETFFGSGLVRTSEDFGTRGSAPSHPELLDWLAVQFHDGGWSVKELHRLIATSATYRQASVVRPDQLVRDPRNELLSRFPRLRLDAETLRDQALASSGLLNPAIGGPSVFPPQPEGVTQLAYGAPAWPTSTGPDRYRRGLYTYARRTSPYAAFALFDAPSGEACVPRRNRGTTPMQALTLLNDIVFNEAAAALARRTLLQSGGDDERLTFAFRVCLSRGPAAEEQRALRAFLQSRRETGMDEAACWTVLCRAIINLDEFQTRE